MVRFIGWFKGAFEWHDNGASARKLTAFTMVACLVLIDFNWVRHAYSKEDFAQLMPMVWAHIFFIGLLLGIKSIDKLIEYKFGGKKHEKPNDNQ